MRDFKLTDGDLDTSGSDFAVVSDAEQVAQACTLRLQTFFGEWFVNLDYGTRWMDILGQHYSEAAVTELITAQLRTVAGVTEIVFIACVYADRSVSVTFTVRTNSGVASGAVIL